MITAQWAGFEVYLIRLLSSPKHRIRLKLLIAFLWPNPVLIGLSWPHHSDHLVVRNRAPSTGNEIKH